MLLPGNTARRARPRPRPQKIPRHAIAHASRQPRYFGGSSDDGNLGLLIHEAIGPRHHPMKVLLKFCNNAVSRVSSYLTHLRLLIWRGRALLRLRTSVADPGTSNKRPT